MKERQQEERMSEVTELTKGKISPSEWMELMKAAEEIHLRLASRNGTDCMLMADLVTVRGEDVFKKLKKDANGFVTVEDWLYWLEAQHALKGDQGDQWIRDNVRLSAVLADKAVHEMPELETELQTQKSEALMKNEIQSLKSALQSANQQLEKQLKESEEAAKEKLTLQREISELKSEVARDAETIARLEQNITDVQEGIKGGGVLTPVTAPVKVSVPTGKPSPQTPSKARLAFEEQMNKLEETMPGWGQQFDAEISRSMKPNRASCSPVPRVDDARNRYENKLAEIDNITQKRLASMYR